MLGKIGEKCKTSIEAYSLKVNSNFRSSPFPRRVPQGRIEVGHRTASYRASARPALAVWMCVALMPLAVYSATLHAQIAADHGRVYYVSQISGNDKNAGSATSPFASISKCARVARAGDTCIVRAGIYRETVRPYRSGRVGSPIIFRAATGEKVVVTGLNRLAAKWSRYSQTIISTKLKVAAKQLFVNGEQMRISRYPGDAHYFQPTYATITSAECRAENGTWSRDISDCEKYDENGPCSKTNNCWSRSFPKILWRITSRRLPGSTRWRGGIISIVDKGFYNAESAVITQSTSRGEIEFAFFAERNILPGMKFFITNSVAAIHGSGEWSYDPSSRELYFDPPRNWVPSGTSVRVRDLAFDLRGRSYITVTGFNIFAASIVTGPNSVGCVLDHLDVRYPVYYKMFGDSEKFPGQGTNRYSISAQTMGKGITLGGHGNVLENSSISHSWCDGVTVYGSHNDVVDNDVSDVDWSMTECAAVTTNGNHQLVKRNRLHDCGRSCLWFQNTYNSEFSYNDIFDACWLGKDCGIAGAYGWTGRANPPSGNSIDHNWIHDNKNAFGGACLYLDNDERGYLVDHNVLWGCQTAFILNDTYIPHGPTDDRVFNNTCFDVAYRISDFGKGRHWKLEGVKFSNNLCTTSRDAHYNQYNAAGIEMENNVGPGDADRYASHESVMPWTTEDLRLVNPKRKDFTPGKYSPARHRGRGVLGINNTKQGIPSAGAYEYGQRNAWRVGPISP